MTSTEQSTPLHDELQQKKRLLELLVGKIVSAKRTRLDRPVADKPPDLVEVHEDIPEGPGRIDSYKHSLSEITTEAAVLLVDLRRINRSILTLEENVKGETETVKAPVESTTLVLNNYQYEISYYTKAIKACRDFKTKYPDIELVDTLEFLKEAPAHLTLGFQTKVTVNGSMEEDNSAEPTAVSMEMMIPRLNYELLQRKQLAKQRQELEMRRKTLQESIASRKKFLAGLPAQLRILKTAAQPLQQHLQVPHSQRIKQHRRASLLPEPLYLLYSQVLAYQGLLGDNAASLEVSLEGSIRDAELLAKADVLKQADERKGEEGTAVIEEDDSASRRRRKSSKDLSAAASAGASEDASAATKLLKGLDSSHPLSVVLNLFSSSSTENQAEEGGAPRSPLVSLRFKYLVRLQVVAAEAEGEVDADFLVDLFPGDCGTIWPNAATLSLGQPFIATLASRKARPYIWCQHLAAVDILPDLPPSLMNPGHSISSKGALQPQGLLSRCQLVAHLRRGLLEYGKQRRVAAVVRQLRERKAARETLKAQLDDLASLRIPSAGQGPWPQDYSSKPPGCRLAAWSALDWEVPSHSQGMDPNDTPVVDGLDPGSAASRALMTSEAARPVASRALVQQWLRSSGVLTSEVEGLVGIRLFRGMIRWERDSSSLDLGLLVCIFPDYPSQPPLFALEVLASSLPSRSTKAGKELTTGELKSVVGHPMLQPLAFWDTQQEVNLSRLREDMYNSVGKDILTHQLVHAMVQLDQVLRCNT